MRKPVATLLLLLSIALILALLLLPIELHGFGSRRAVQHMRDIGHLPLFALFTYTLLVWGSAGRRRRLSNTIVVTAAAACALIMELVQPFVGRTAESADLILGVTGCLAALMIFEGRKNGLRFPYVVVVLICVSVIMPLGVIYWDEQRAIQDLPVLGSFEDDIEVSRWYPVAASVARTKQGVTHGESALRIKSTDPAAKFCSVFLTEGPANWSPYSELQFDVYNETQELLYIMVRVDDKPGVPSYHDRSQVVVDVGVGQQTLHVDFSDLARTPSGRELDFTRVDKVGIFWYNTTRSPVVVDRVVLVK